MKPDIWPDTGYKKAGYPVQPLFLAGRDMLKG